MNNITVLKKCLEELGKDTPRLDYLRGILETLLEMQSDRTIGINSNSNAIVEWTHSLPTVAHETAALNEAAVLDAKARAALETVKKLNQTDE